MAGRSRILTYGLPSVGAVALVAGVVLVAGNRPVATAEPPPRAPVAAPDAAAMNGDAPALPGNGGDSAGFIGAIGVSEPPGEAIGIAAQRSGVVTAVDVEVGDEVGEGDPLFRVESRPAENAVLLAETRVAVAASDVATLEGRLPVREAAVEAAEAQLASAEADRDDARNRLKVAESVTDKRAIAAEEVDQRRFAAAVGRGPRRHRPGAARLGRTPTCRCSPTTARSCGPAAPGWRRPRPASPTPAPGWSCSRSAPPSPPRCCR